MDRLTQLKLALIVLAVAAFGIGMARQIPWLNWVAIGLLTVGLVLRFVGARGRR